LIENESETECKQECYYPNSFLKVKQKCLEKTVILETIDPAAEGPYAAGCTAAVMQCWKRCVHGGSV